MKTLENIKKIPREIAHLLSKDKKLCSLLIDDSNEPKIENLPSFEFLLNNNYITFNCIRNGGFLIQSTNLIDFSKYKYLRVKCDAYITNDVSNSQVNISLLSRHYTSWYDTSNWATVLIIQDGLFGHLEEYGEYENHILTINLENIQDAYMCFYVAGNPKPVNVYEIYLETEDVLENTLSETIKKATKEIILNNKLFQEHCLPYKEE